jgi:bifunctional enzyme CysN/CysC
MLLDGDQLRHGLNGDLGFSNEDRTENIRRAGEVARLFFEQGCIVLCSFVSPFRADRERIEQALPEGRFIEIHVDCDLDTLKQRDPKGLYARAGRGEVRQLTGVHSAYEPPVHPALRIDTAATPVAQSVAQLVELLRAQGVID